MPEPSVSAAAMRIVRELVGNPPQCVADLIEATGVTRTAVTEQLNELMSAGYVERGTEHLEGRGRPRHVYSTTDAALTLLFVSNQRLVVPAIWKAVRELGGPGLTDKVLRSVAKTLAEHYKTRIRAKRPEKRLNQMIRLLREEGGLIEAVQDDGRLIMRKRSCPFITMLDDENSVCCVDQEMMSEVVGRTVRRTACRYEGSPCCTFEIVDAE